MKSLKWNTKINETRNKHEKHSDHVSCLLSLFWWFIPNMVPGIYTTKNICGSYTSTVNNICSEWLNFLLTGNEKVSTTNYRHPKYVHSSNFHPTHVHSITFWFLIWIITRTPYSVSTSKLNFTTVQTEKENLQFPVDFATNMYFLL
jgi:hypothetical protein